MIVCIAIWLELGLFFVGFDRRPTDSVRCRKCFYDLRATVSEACPECGADLTKTGVWPVGTPNRARAQLWAVAWLWTGVVGVVAATNFYHRHNSWIATHRVECQDVIFLATPESGSHRYVSIGLCGSKWELFSSDMYGSRVEPEIATVYIYNTYRQSDHHVNFDIETMRAVPHPMDWVNTRQENRRAANGSRIQYGDKITPELLAEFLPLGEDRALNAQILAEMEEVIELAQTAGGRDKLLWRWGEVEAFSRDVLNKQGSLSNYGRRNAVEEVYDRQLKYLPAWLIWVVLGLGVLILILGLFLIRRRCYLRDLVPWDRVKGAMSSVGDP